MFDYNRLQKLQRSSRAPAKVTYSQQSGIHIEPKAFAIAERVMSWVAQELGMWSWGMHAGRGG